MDWKSWKMLFIVLILFSSCGLENIIYLEPPKITSTVTHFSGSTVDPSKMVMEFKTTDGENDAVAAGYFKGFNVYYLIYKTKEQAESEKNSIESYNSNNPINACKWLQESKKYMRLGNSPFIPRNGVDRNIKIRMYELSPNKAGLYINNVWQRNIARVNGTDFFKAQISSSDSDVFNDATTNSDYWANFFVVTYGLNENFTLIYSELEYLGSINLQ